MPSPYHDKRNSYCQFKSQKNTPGFWCILREKLHAKQRQKQTNLVVSCQVASQYMTSNIQHQYMTSNIRPNGILIMVTIRLSLQHSLLPALLSLFLNTCRISKNY
jgi:hypothetical protein